jgi:HPt (histidine-containing phosphotransfer) domain-containing protein
VQAQTVKSGQSNEFDYAAALGSADAWVIETIGQDFLDDCPRQMKEIEDAIHASEFESLRRSAHTLRGLAGNFNATRIAELASDLEQFGNEADVPEAGLVYSRLKSEIEALNLALVNFLAQIRSRATP